jgi:hypothetical protein
MSAKGMTFNTIKNEEQMEVFVVLPDRESIMKLSIHI